MEFTFKYSNPERALLRKQTLQAEINQYDAEIAQIQSQRAEAMDEMAALQTMLLQNGHAIINIEPINQLPPPEVEQKPVASTKSLPEYNNSWSLNLKIIYAFLAFNPKAEWTTDEIKEKLKALEPNNPLLKNVSTIVGQNSGKCFTRIPKDGSKPAYKLLKGAEKLVLDLR